MWRGFEHGRAWLAPTGVLLALIVLVPPAGVAAGHYVYVQAVQFAVLATVAPALIVLGAPWKKLITASSLNWLANARSHRSSARFSWLALLCYLALIIVWRLPVSVNALVQNPGLTVLEAFSLVACGCALWLELVESPPFLPRINRPLRAAFAAVPMWTIWAGAYIMAFSRTAWFSAYAQRPGHGLSVAVDQQVAAGVLWAIPAFCFVPVVYFALITWLRDSNYPDDELRREPAAESGLPRPPRGWRA
jgi:cytochrome c oxidase assembly factor CtaG